MVVLSFLPVGHTHEDIDSLFSQLSHKLKNTNQCLTPDHFLDVLTESTKPEDPSMFHKVKYLYHGMYDFKSKIAEVLHSFSNIKKVLIFTFMIIVIYCNYNYILKLVFHNRLAL